MKATPIIRSKTITAADLLRKIRTLALEEPKRVNMGYFFSMFNGKAVAGLSLRESKVPACGTVGCIAGWGALLLRQAKSECPVYARPIMDEALGMGSHFMGPDDVYSPSAIGTFGETQTSDIMARGGTKRHARGVARRITIFLARHPELETRVIKVR